MRLTTVFRHSVTAVWVAVNASAGSTPNHDGSAGPCAESLSKGVVCETANERALQIMSVVKLDAITVVQDVKTGSLIAVAASNPAKLDVMMQVLPLSTVKLMVAASWWDHGQPDDPQFADAPKMSVAEMIVSGNDNAGRRIASALRETMGTETVLRDLERYGFQTSASSRTPKKDETFWAELAPKWRERLTPGMAYHSLGVDTTTRDWEDVLSLSLLPAIRKETLASRLQRL